ncbi:MAG: ABC transporter permease, partial [Rhodospirillaceae bacterium]|nr:ABC transporter permease [Rhodospirillaceae bacterium]
IGVAVGEMGGGSEGLGAVLVGGGGSGNTALVFVAIVMMTLVGILAYIGVVFLEKRVLHYMPRNEFNQI